MDVDSPHVSTVPSDFDAQSVKTSTQAERLEREEEEKEKEAAQAEREQRRNSSRASGKGKSKEKEKEKEKEKGAEKAKAGKEKAKQGAHEAKERAESCIAKLRRNKGNPVVVANALLIAVASGIVGYHAYERHLKGMLNWEVVAAWGGAIGLGVGADYFVSRFVFFSSDVPGLEMIDADCLIRWLLQNKYPPK